MEHRAKIVHVRQSWAGHDKIAECVEEGEGVSNQAICLQMAAAKEWGHEQYARLDPFTITLPHPDAAIAIISKSTEVAGHYGVAPFQNYELRRRVPTRC